MVTGSPLEMIRNIGFSIKSFAVSDCVAELMKLYRKMTSERT